MHRSPKLPFFQVGKSTLHVLIHCKARVYSFVIHAALSEVYPAVLTCTSPTACQSVSESPIPCLQDDASLLAWPSKNGSLPQTCGETRWCWLIHWTYLDVCKHKCRLTELTKENKEREGLSLSVSRVRVLDEAEMDTVMQVEAHEQLEDSWDDVII